MSPPLIELGAAVDAPIMHIAAANGFPPQTYLPMLRAWLADYRVICLPPRAMWGDQRPPTDYQDWRGLADDLLAGFAAWNLRDVVALGHSMGAVVSMLAAIKQPQRFKALILLDPVMLLPNELERIGRAWQQRAVDQLPMAARAKRRRRFFDSRNEALAHFRAKPLFADWSDEALRLYAEHGLRAGAEGFELTWPPEWEAWYFSTVPLKIWETLPKLEGLVPTFILRGETSAAFVKDAFNDMKRALPSADCRQVAGQGHLFPQSAPQMTSQMIQTWLDYFYHKGHRGRRDFTL